LAEERDLIYARGIGDAAGGGTAEAMLGEDSGGGCKDCVTVIHGAEAMEAGQGMQVVTYLHTRFHDLV
jgi:hypothetical protein